VIADHIPIGIWLAIGPHIDDGVDSFDSLYESECTYILERKARSKCATLKLLVDDE
jgi:hypothetical protein